MADLLIRGVDDEVVRDIDERAARLGLSRNECLKREVSARHRSLPPATVEDLDRASSALADLLNPEVMRGAWRE